MSFFQKFVKMKIEIVDSLPGCNGPAVSPITTLVPSQDQFPPLPLKLTQLGISPLNSSDGGTNIRAGQVSALQEGFPKISLM